MNFSFQMGAIILPCRPVALPHWIGGQVSENWQMLFIKKKENWQMQ